jgi:hypothetical protein
MCPPNWAEVQVLRDKCEELADDVRALHETGISHPSFGVESRRNWEDAPRDTLCNG